MLWLLKVSDCWLTDLSQLLPSDPSSAAGDTLLSGLSPRSLFLPTQLASHSSADRRSLPLLGPGPVCPLGLVWAFLRHSDAWAVHPPQASVATTCTSTWPSSCSPPEPRAYLTSPLGCPQAPEHQSIENTLSIFAQSSPPSCWPCPPSARPPSPGGHRELPPPLSLHVLSHDIRSHPFH